MVAFVDAPTDGGASDWSAWVRWQPFDPVLLQATGEARSLARARIIPFDLAVGDNFAILASLRVGDNSCDSGTLYSAPLSDSGELLDAPVPIQCPRTCDDCWIEPPITMSMAWGLGGWTIAFRHLAYGAVLVRTDARGTAVQAQTLDAWGEYEWPIEVAFDGEGFGVLGLDDTGPVFARYVVEP